MRTVVVTLFGVWMCALAQAAERPHIVYILVDDMGSADCGFSGGTEIHTPHIDALAQQGAVFDNYYVQPLCSTTRACFMTGRYPVRHGIYGALKPDSGFGLPLEERTLAQSLGEAGYTTAITGKWHLGEHEVAYRPTSRGFDHQYGIWYGQIDYFTHERAGRIEWYRDDQPCTDKGYSTHLIADEAAKLIAQQSPEKPLFLYVPFNAVHGPFQVPDKYLAPYKDMPPKRATMAAMLSVVDEAVGKITAALEKQGLSENTLVIFSADNGGVNPQQMTSNGKRRAGKATLYEGGIHTCAFATWPGRIEAGSRIAEPVHIVDWYPTLIGLAGGKVDQPLPVDGVDIGALLREGKPLDREAILVTGAAAGRAALRMGDWKLIVTQPAAARSGTGGVELYNLANDASEQHDLASQEPQRVKTMLTKWAEYYRDAAQPPAAASQRRQRRAA